MFASWTRVLFTCLLAVALSLICNAASLADSSTAPSVEGMWTVTATNTAGRIGTAVSIVRSDDGYHVTESSYPFTSGVLLGLYQGGRTSISETVNFTFAQMRSALPSNVPDSAIQEAVGRFIVTGTLTLSPDGQSMYAAQNTYQLNWYLNTGALAGLMNIPDHYQTTLQRVEPPAPPVQNTPQLRQAARSRAQRLRLDMAQLARLVARRRSLQRQLTILDRVRAQQRGSNDEMNRFRQDILQDGMIDAVGLAANSAVLGRMGLSPESAEKASAILERYRIALNLAASKNASDEADITGDIRTRRKSEEKALDAAKDIAKQLAALAMPKDALQQISALVDSAHEAFKTNQNLAEDHTIFEKGAIALDGFSRFVAAFDPTGRLSALRTSGDIVAAAGLYLKVTWDQQSVRDADNSAKYAQGLIVTRIDAINRQQHAMQVQIQRDRHGP